jgi:hypothetical protein
MSRIQPGDIVKMKAGYSAPGTVLEVMERHPRADDPRFHTIKNVLGLPHVKVFWSDLELELLPASQIERVECE